MCGSTPLSNARVKLWDEDDLDPDDELDSTLSDAEGKFEVQGSTREMTNINPRLKIYHDCNDNLPCQRKVKVIIPDEYINKGKTVIKWFNTGAIDLKLKFSGEERSCRTDIENNRVVSVDNSEKPAALSSDPDNSEIPADLSNDPDNSENPADLSNDPDNSEKPADLSNDPDNSEKHTDLSNENLSAGEMSDLQNNRSDNGIQSVRM